MTSTSGIVSDLAALRSHLRASDPRYPDLLRVKPWVALRDILFDWLVVFGAVAAVVWGGWGWVLLAVLVIGNRQRALGNVLHDAGHGNLWRNRVGNDTVAQLLVAPLLFASLTRYRVTHFQHHARLGDAASDPDFLHHTRLPERAWLTTYARFVLSWRSWLGSLGGHLFDPAVHAASKSYIVVWWASLLGLLWWFAGRDFAVTFSVVWLVARATAFHIITTFREMCDHFGLQPGGVFSFTRDMHCHGFWRVVIHPRNNGYHLTHHLLPAVPYYHLPAAHEVLQQTALYRDRSSICTAYFSGTGSVTRSWAQGVQ
ncbi:MAG: fatty acid desaturase [Hydrogenophaga sp.]|jgi:fatty acid desaturase|nr:fatty acid desaturase [Hydrogenophaga sp.]